MSLREDANNNEKKLLPGYGFTTGSCAAAAAKAAARMLLENTDVHAVSLMTPAGIELLLDVQKIMRTEESVSCAIQKDSGDDPDVTGGTFVFAEFSLSEESGIEIEGGRGIGIVTRPGLDQPVGNAAINSVPRRMIREAVEEELHMHGCEKGARVIISIPDGETLAARTFNPKLGIVGGISVLGTTGIVKPMSDEAIVATIEAQIRVRRAEGAPVLLLTPGNYGQEFLQKRYGLGEDAGVICSNFAKASMELAAANGFSRILFAGHIGKLVKIATGMGNTHSRYGDHRMETIVRVLDRLREDQKRRNSGRLHGDSKRNGGEGFPVGGSDVRLSKNSVWSRDCVREVSEQSDAALREEILRCVSTDDALDVLESTGWRQAVCDRLVEEVRRQLCRWAGKDTKVSVMMFRNGGRPVGKTAEAEQDIEILQTYLKEKKPGV